MSEFVPTSPSTVATSARPSDLPLPRRRPSRAARAAASGATPIALAGLVANGANIGVTLLVARLLSTREYGALNQLVAIFFVLSIPGSALLVGIVRRVTWWTGTGRGHLVGPWAARTRRRAVAAIVVVAVVAALLRAPLADLLHLPGPGGVAEIVVAGATWALLCVERGLMQAAHSYRRLGANLLVEGLGRSLLTVVLVGAGLGVTGAAVAVLASVVAAQLHGALTTRTRTGVDVTDVTDDAADTRVDAADRSEGRALAGDLAAALVALGLLAVLQNFDVVLLGREQPGNAGSWAPVSVACKPLVLAAFVLAGFLLPEAAHRRHAGGHALRQLALTLGVVAVPAAVLVAISAAVPRFVLRTAFGDRLTGAAPAFASLAVAMTLLAATVLFTHYLLATGHRGVLVALAAGTVLTLVLLGLAGGHLVATARADLVGQAVVAAATGLLVLRTARGRAS